MRLIAILKVMKNILALLADFANGIFAVLIAAYIYQIEVLYWHILLGIGCALIPDIDAISELIRRGRVSASAIHLRDHRTFLHYPIFSLPLALIGIIFFGYAGVIFGVAVLLHLMNDLYGTGWGIAIGWPWSGRHLKIFGRRVNRTKKHLKETEDWYHISPSDRKLRLVVCWSADELPKYIQRWGYEKWIERTYLHLNWTSSIEYSLFVIAVGLLIIQS